MYLGLLDKEKEKLTVALTGIICCSDTNLSLGAMSNPEGSSVSCIAAFVCDKLHAFLPFEPRSLEIIEE